MELKQEEVVPGAVFWFGQKQRRVLFVYVKDPSSAESGDLHVDWEYASNVRKCGRGQTPLARFFKNGQQDQLFDGRDYDE